ncbi:MAG: hypothetical protein NVS4B12_26700 [Ktedonobacteraceae bacterium]
MNTQMLLLKSEISTPAEETSDVVPTRILEVELGQPLRAISAFDDKTGRLYQRALCLIRLHTRPLGVVQVLIGESGVSADELAAHIWRSLQGPIIEHLCQDGLPPATALVGDGLCSTSVPRCSEEREKFLAHAPFVSVIVATRDRPDNIENCLHFLLALQYPRYEIIIVDNAPTTDATATLVQQVYKDMSQVRYVREDCPGLSQARNCGMMAAKGEILVFTDDDVTIDPNWLVELVRAFEGADDVACVTGLVLPLELETPAQHWFEEYGGFNKGFTRRNFDQKVNRSEMPLHPYTTGRFGTGANMAFTAAFLRGVGGFDPSLGAGSPTRGGEELAAFFQVITHGYKLIYEPAALVYHCHRRDYPGLRKQIYNYGLGLTAYLMKSVLDNPRLLFDLLTKLPYGLFFILSSRSPKNSKKSASYPQELTRLEFKGMLHGPLVYLRSRWATRHARKALRTSKG